MDEVICKLQLIVCLTYNYRTCDDQVRKCKVATAWVGSHLEMRGTRHWVTHTACLCACARPHLRGDGSHLQDWGLRLVPRLRIYGTQVRCCIYIWCFASALGQVKCALRMRGVWSQMQLCICKAWASLAVSTTMHCRTCEDIFRSCASCTSNVPVASAISKTCNRRRVSRLANFPPFVET